MSSTHPILPQLVQAGRSEQSTQENNSALSFTQPIMMNTPNVTQHISIPASQSVPENGFPMMVFNKSAVFHGGNFIQHISQTIQKGSFDILKESVAPNAFHNSGAEFDPPKCHANTRVAILKKIVDWVHGCDEKTSKYPIMWLNGAAGAGKTAIMHTVLEQLTSEGIGVASFFFWRSDPTRNHVKAFIATLAFQIYQFFPDIRHRILSVMDDDHFLFSRSLSHQFSSIIASPAKNLSSASRYLVAIDGLDECLDREAQCHILQTLAAGIRQFELPFAFLIASRPEIDIRSSFDSMTGLFTRLTLDNDYQSFKDIDLYLRNSFVQIKKDHPFRRLLSPTWPEENNMREIVAKSSGQFVYAATVVKFVKFLRRRPDHSLDILLKLRPSNKDLPFSELDSLYMHILSSMLDAEPALQAFSYMMLDGGSSSMEDIECILSLEKGELEVSLCDIHAIMSISGGRARFLHASFQDFLLDPTRSKHFYIDLEEHKSKHLVNTFRIFALPNGPQRLTPYDYSAKQLSSGCPLTPELRLEIERFSLQKLADDSNTRDKSLGLFQQFIPAFFQFLPRLEQEDENLIEDYLHQLDLVILSRLPHYYSVTNRFLDIVWLCFHKTFKLFKPTPLLSGQDSEHYDPLAIRGFNMHKRNIFVDDISFDEYLMDLLQDHECSGEYAFSTQVFTLAAYDCLIALASYDVNEPLKTLSAITAEGLDDSTEWEDLSNFDVVEDDDDKDDSDPTTRSDSRGTTRSDIETHRILAFILYLLPRSGKYDPLIDLCQDPGPCFYHSKRYAGVNLQLNFPIRFERLIKEMNRYLERVDAEENKVAEAACYQQDFEADGPLCEVCEIKDKEKVKWRRRA